MGTIQLIGIDDETEYRSLGEYAYSVLRRNIVRGVLRPGGRLRAEALADLLDVSRMPVREALQRLNEEGLVTFRSHGRGAVVSTPEPQRVFEYSQARWALERLAGQLAAVRADEATDNRLNDLIVVGRKAAETDDWERNADLSSRFHLIVARASGNSHLYDLIRRHDDFLGWAASSMSRVLKQNRWDFHERIAAAIRARDPEATAREMEIHGVASTRPFEERLEQAAQVRKTADRPAPTSSVDGVGSRAAAASAE